MDILKFIAELFDVSYILLFVLLWMAWHILRRAERPDNYWSGVFSDDAGKRSALRVATLVALAVTSAALMYLVVNSTKNVADMDALWKWWTVYVCAWSGAPVVSKALDYLIAKSAP